MMLTPVRLYVSSDAIVLAKAQVLAKEALFEDVLLEFHPLREPLLRGNTHLHQLGSDEAVQ
jgi:hypothetical protein